MTEQEWLECDEPVQLLKRARFRSYQRKSRLFAVACCRRIWDALVDERSRQAVEVAERHADGLATDEALRLACEAAHAAHREMFDTVGKVGACIEWAAAYAADANPCRGARCVTWMAATSRAFEVRRVQPDDDYQLQLFPCTVTRSGRLRAFFQGKWKVTLLDEAVATGADKQVQAALLRCIFGSPFRPAHVVPTWRTPAAIALAQAVYDDRCFQDLPILADALEEASCTDADMLQHLRGAGPHARGCWAVDLVLGKE
jgi:hypothetical protein